MQYIGQISPDLAPVGVKRGKVVLRLSGFSGRIWRNVLEKCLDCEIFPAGEDGRQFLPVSVN
jgi:hypothetical protein